MFTLGIVALMGGVLQINPIWNMGPYNPSQVSAGTQPDFYMMWTDGFLRLFPAWELYLFGHTVPGPFAVAVLMIVVFGLLIGYPWIEKRLSGDHAPHNLLQRPRDVPVRTAIGAMALSFYLILTLACVNDIIALRFDISLNATTWIFRIGLLIVPPLAYLLAYRMCIALQRNDRSVLEHGIETGIVRRLPHGEYIEIHQPLGPADEFGHPIPLEYQGAAIPKKMNRLGLSGKPGSGSFLRADPQAEAEQLEAADRTREREQLAVLRSHRGGPADAD
jgi:ubiquinol-cytochrome c reductase cytochrome b subunit